MDSIHVGKNHPCSCVFVDGSSSIFFCRQKTPSKTFERSNIFFQAKITSKTFQRVFSGTKLRMDVSIWKKPLLCPFSLPVGGKSNHGKITGCYISLLSPLKNIHYVHFSDIHSSAFYRSYHFSILRVGKKIPQAGLLFEKRIQFFRFTVSMCKIL